MRGISEVVGYRVVWIDRICLSFLVRRLLRQGQDRQYLRDVASVFVLSHPH